jgi:hypothetical protein
MVLQYGWLFGARCIIGAGTADERDTRVWVICPRSTLMRMVVWRVPTRRLMHSEVQHCGGMGYLTS